MYYSQEWTAQDKFVAETLEFKKDGTFLDVGFHHYKNIRVSLMELRFPLLPILKGLPQELLLQDFGRFVSF